MVIQQYKDFARALDYLETRGDIAHDRIGYFGVSGRARLALIFAYSGPGAGVNVICRFIGLRLRTMDTGMVRLLPSQLRRNELRSRVL